MFVIIYFVAKNIPNYNENNLTWRRNHKEIILFASDMRYFNDEQKELMLLKNSTGEFSHIDSLSYFAAKGYESFKEYLSYQLIAHQLYENDIELAVISDHNTISGFKGAKLFGAMLSALLGGIRSCVSRKEKGH